MHYGGCQRRVRRPLGGLVEKRGGLAEPGCRVAHVANAHRGVGVKIGIGEPGQGVECLPERLGRGAVYRPAHDTAPEEVPMSMRSPQGSRFQSPGGWA